MDRLEYKDITFPCLIHGIQGSGASQFTISLAAYLAKSGEHVVYFCAFPPGKEKLEHELANLSTDKVTIINPGDERELQHHLEKADSAIFVVKNFETISENIQSSILNLRKVVISGDLTSVTTLGSNFPTVILFSPNEMFGVSELPSDLAKYDGYIIQGDNAGIIRLA